MFNGYSVVCYSTVCYSVAHTACSHNRAHFRFLRIFGITIHDAKQSAKLYPKNDLKNGHYWIASNQKGMMNCAGVNSKISQAIAIG